MYFEEKLQNEVFSTFMRYILPHKFFWSYKFIWLRQPFNFSIFHSFNLSSPIQFSLPRERGRG